MHHHYKSLGGWTFAFNDYHELNITGNMDTPEFNALQRIVDPYGINFFELVTLLDTSVLIYSLFGSFCKHKASFG